MSTRYSKAEVKSLVKDLEVEAIQAGLLSFDHQLQYEAGNTSYNIATVIRVVDGNKEYVPSELQHYFIPSFAHNAGPTAQASLIVAAKNVLTALRWQRERAAEAAEKQLANR